MRENLIGGFIIYFQGSRYDYSVKGQLDRIGSFIKRTRSIDGYEDGIAAQRKALTEEDFPATKVKKDLEKALEQFPESSQLSIDNVEIFELSDEELDKRVENAFVSREHKDEIGRVSAISDGVASVTGLRNCMLNELIYFASGATGIAMNLENLLLYLWQSLDQTLH